MPAVCHKGNISEVPPHSHGKSCCPHPAKGPAVTGAPKVLINGQPALRALNVDRGVHSTCCGPNTWVTQEGSPSITVDGFPLVRLGDQTLHCMVFPGKMITAASIDKDELDVIADHG